MNEPQLRATTCWPRLPGDPRSGQSNWLRTSWSVASHQGSPTRTSNGGSKSSRFTWAAVRCELNSLDKSVRSFELLVRMPCPLLRCTHVASGPSCASRLCQLGRSSQPWSWARRRVAELLEFAAPSLSRGIVPWATYAGCGPAEVQTTHTLQFSVGAVRSGPWRLPQWPMQKPMWASGMANRTHVRCMPTRHLTTVCVMGAVVTTNCRVPREQVSFANGARVCDRPPATCERPGRLPLSKNCSGVGSMHINIRGPTAVPAEGRNHQPHGSVPRGRDLVACLCPHVLS